MRFVPENPWHAPLPNFVIIFFLISMQLGCGGNLAAPSGTTPSALAAAQTPGPAGQGGPIPSPNPPPGATVFSQIEEMSGWLTCGSCGNSGGSGPTATYSMTRGISPPSEDGSSAEFAISGSSPYVNAYWYIEHPPVTAQINALTYQLDIYVPAGFESAPQAIEFECQQRLDGWVYNFAWQANYAGGTWRLFDYVNQRWDDSGIALQKFSPDSWHHLVAEYHTDVAQKLYIHDALTVDGVRYPVNKTHSAKNTGNMTDEFTNAFQLDTNSTPQAYHVFVDQMKVTVQ